MTVTPTATREAETYLAQVRGHLADLGEDERAELLEDLAQHLADVSTEEGNADSDLRALLGDPAVYAAELRAAAGLPPKVGTPATADGGSWIDGARSLWSHPKFTATRRIAAELLPAWWVLRGLLIVGLFVAGAQERWRHIPIPQVYGSRLLGLIVVIAVVSLSVAVGRAGYAGWRRLALLADAAVAGLSLLLLVQLTSIGYFGALGSQPRSVVQVEVPPRVLESRHGPVTNIYPYDAQGRPLEGVLLFDQDGRPLRSALQEWWRDGCRRAPAHPRAADGVPVEFSYPHRYAVEPQPGIQGCLETIPRPAVPLPTFGEAAPAASPDAGSGTTP